MVERKDYSQLELFSQSQDSGRRMNTGRIFLLGYVRGYEKAILLFVSFIAIGIISFSLGVEKGRRLAAVPKPGIRLDLAAVQAPKPQIQPQNNYTIQLASYQSKTYAQRQAELLKKKGLTTLVLPKGSYTILCVGSFADKEKARPLLSELKKKYQDSFIRRL